MKETRRNIDIPTDARTGKKQNVICKGRHVSSYSVVARAQIGRRQELGFVSMAGWEWGKDGWGKRVSGGQVHSTPAASPLAPAPSPTHHPQTRRPALATPTSKSPDASLHTILSIFMSSMCYATAFLHDALILGVSTCIMDAQRSI